MTSRKRNKGRTNGQIEVAVSWQHTAEISPEFKWVMTRLLQAKSRKSGYNNEHKRHHSQSLQQP